MLMKRDRNSFRATLLAGVSGLALMGVVALPIGTAKAQSNVLVNNGGPPAGSATTNVTIGGAGNNLAVPGNVTVGSSIQLHGGTGGITGGGLSVTGGVSGASGNFTTLGGAQLTGNIDAGGKTLRTRTSWS